MNYSQKREMYRRVRSAMTPTPRWNSWDAIPTCETGCTLYVGGKCAWNKSDMAVGCVCVPVVTMCLDSLGRRLRRGGK